MININDYNFLTEEFMQRLNFEIEKVVEEKENTPINYTLLRKIMEKISKNSRFINGNEIVAVCTMKREEMIRLGLEFFKSIDSELYDKALKVILQQDENIKMNIYDIHKVKDFSKQDENGIEEYTADANIWTIGRKSIIHVPEKRELTNTESKIINEIGNANICTLDDLYTFVHEIGHLFDLDEKETLPTRENIQSGDDKVKGNITREMLTESTSIAFEGILTEYLLNNTKYSREAIKQNRNKRMNTSVMRARVTYIKLLLAEEKSKKGTIQKKDVEKIITDNNFSYGEVEDIINNIRLFQESLHFQKRYAIARLISPTIVEMYNQNKSSGGAVKIKKYLEAIKEDKLNEALEVFNIRFDEEGFKILINNMNKEQREINFELDEK